MRPMPHKAETTLPQPVFVPGDRDEGQHGHQCCDHDDQGQTRLLRPEEHGRPQEIQRCLNEPQLHRVAVSIANPAPPADNRYDDIEHRPHRGKDPVWRRERRLVQARVSFARYRGVADEHADQNDAQHERHERENFRHQGSFPSAGEDEKRTTIAGAPGSSL